MSTEYKPKQNSIPNLYSILGLTNDICKEPNCNELIKKAYMSKAKVCHPDKHPGRKDMEEIFELLTGAYDILKDERQRNEYNHKLAIYKESNNDFSRLKKKTSDYMQSIGEYVKPTQQQNIGFEDQNRILDDKHGYNRSIENTPIPKADAKKMLREVEQHRATQDVELKHEKLFDGEQYNPKKFNAAFDKVHKREEDSIMEYNGIPLAWNGMGTTLKTRFASFDDFDNIYVNDKNRVDTSRQNFADVNFGSVSKMTKSDMSNLEDADYYDNHGELGDAYYDDMKAKLRDRDASGNNFERMKYNDFKRDDMAGYGILDQVGFGCEDRLCIDDDDDNISRRFEKIMAERQQM